MADTTNLGGLGGLMAGNNPAVPTTPAYTPMPATYDQYLAQNNGMTTMELKPWQGTMSPNGTWTPNTDIPAAYAAYAAQQNAANMPINLSGPLGGVNPALAANSQNPFATPVAENSPISGVYEQTNNTRSMANILGDTITGDTFKPTQPYQSNPQLLSTLLSQGSPFNAPQSNQNLVNNLQANPTAANAAPAQPTSTTPQWWNPQYIQQQQRMMQSAQPQLPPQVQRPIGQPGGLNINRQAQAAVDQQRRGMGGLNALNRTGRSLPVSFTRPTFRR